MRIITPNNVRLMETNPDKLVWKSINRKREKLIDEAKKDVASLLDDERKRLVAAVRGAVNYSTIPTLTSAQIREQDYLSLLVTLNTEVANIFKEDTLERINLPQPKSFFEALISEYVRNYVATRVIEISTTSRTSIRRITDEAIQQGLSIPDVAKLVDSLYLEDIIPNRSERIARTEVISASNAGSYMAAKSTDIPMKKKWLSTADGRTRDAHALANGQTVDIDGYFIVGGDRLLFPGDTSLGASGENVVACRCTVIYELP